MKNLLAFLAILTICPVAVQAVQLSSTSASAGTAERLGTVSFPISCEVSSQAPFNRGVALLHDFWYTEAQRQFERIVQSDPNCAMAHWGVAMSLFHQIWARPDTDTMKLGWSQMQAAQNLPANQRERAYITTLADFYRPGPDDYSTRVEAYSSAMGRLYAQYPGDVNAGAFYALSLLAAKRPNDTSLTQERKAMAVLTPLFAKDPNNPGVDHYIVHSCDNPAMAREGLAAANHYGQIAPSGPHATHMPGHIYARLGMWPQDIAAQLGSIKASEVAEAHGESGILDEPHSYDFLIYAYLQSGQDAKAKAALGNAFTVLDRIAAMPDRESSRYFSPRIAYYRNELPVFYALEMRKWKTVATMKPVAGSPPQMATLVYWARVIANGHLHQAAQARVDSAMFERLIAEVRQGKNAYMAEGTASKIQRDEMLAWTTFAEGKQAEAFQNMRSAADLQDKVGQQEVDIPAREMLGDMLLEFGHPRQALAEYRVSLKFSPNRFNGLYNAGRAAEVAGNRQQAKFYYAALMKSTGNRATSTRPELAHARKFLSAVQVTAK